jgi:hypothetical protein
MIGALIVTLERPIVDVAGLTTTQGSVIILTGIATVVLGLVAIAIDRIGRSRSAPAN